MGAVLSIRDHFVKQPAVDEKGNVLLWNGEIFGGLDVKNGENDTEVLLRNLRNSVDICNVISTVRGPFAFIYWQVRCGEA